MSIMQYLIMINSTVWGISQVKRRHFNCAMHRLFAHVSMCSYLRCSPHLFDSPFEGAVMRALGFWFVFALCVISSMGHIVVSVARAADVITSSITMPVEPSICSLWWSRGNIAVIRDINCVHENSPLLCALYYRSPMKSIYIKLPLDKHNMLC